MKKIRRTVKCSNVCTVTRVSHTHDAMSYVVWQYIFEQ